MIRVLIADDHRLLVDLLKSDLASSLAIQVVATAANGEEAVHLAKEYKPDVVLMDIQMPVCDGIEATRQIKQENSGINILMLTSSAQDHQIQQAIEAGADGYVLKSISMEELILAIQGVHANMRVVSKSLDITGMTLMDHHLFDWEKEAVVFVEGQPVHLGKREVDLLVMVAEGKSLKEMAETLGFKKGTVQNQITALKKKLKLKDKSQLALFALRQGLLEP